MALAGRALDIPNVTGASALSIFMLCERLEHLVLTLLMLMLGFEYLVAGILDLWRRGVELEGA